MNSPTKSVKAGDALGYDPVERHRKIETQVIRKRIDRVEAEWDAGF